MTTTQQTGELWPVFFVYFARVVRVVGRYDCSMMNTQDSDVMTITVTAANPHEAICQQLIAELSAELGARYGDDGSALFTPDDVTGPRAAFVVARLDDDPVGCGALRPMKHDATIAEIKRMFVRQTARGRGISRHILTALETLAADKGYQAVQLETGTLQPEAIGLYEAAGYRRMGCYEPYTSDPLSICYEKRFLD